MAKVVEGFLLGTHYDLTFYLMDGELYVRMKSSLSRKKVKYSPRFQRTMQSAEEMRRASKLASRIYWELSKEQKKMVFVLYKKMTGVAKLAFKFGKSEAEAEREVREYLVREGVVKVAVEEKRVEKEQRKTEVRKGEVILGLLKNVFAIPYDYGEEKRLGRRKRGLLIRRRVALFDG